MPCGNGFGVIKNPPFLMFKKRDNVKQKQAAAIRKHLLLCLDDFINQ